MLARVMQFSWSSLVVIVVQIRTLFERWNLPDRVGNIVRNIVSAQLAVVETIAVPE